MNNDFFKKLLEKMPFNRLLVYLIAFGFIPPLCAALYFVQQKSEWNGVSDQIAHIQNIAYAQARKQQINMVVRSVYAQADPKYLENQLEPLNFLKKEREAIEVLLGSPTFTGNESAEKRYGFLSSGKNQLSFQQGAPVAAEGLEETPCLLSHPVEVDGNDLKELLGRIEGGRKGKPQLLISDFKLNRKAHTSGNEVFELNMKLIKREFHT